MAQDQGRSSLQEDPGIRGTGSFRNGILIGFFVGLLLGGVGGYSVKEETKSEEREPVLLAGKVYWKTKTIHKTKILKSGFSAGVAKSLRTGDTALWAVADVKDVWIGSAEVMGLVSANEQYIGVGFRVNFD